MPAVTPADRRKITRLHGKGLGRNEIAKQAGFSAATITKVCREAGLTFDRTATKAAVAARTVDLRARRQAILDRLYTRAETNLTRLEAATYDYTVILAGGAEEGAHLETVHDVHAPSADERNHMTAITGYLGQAVKLEQIDGSATASKTESIIARVAEAFGVSDA